MMARKKINLGDSFDSTINKAKTAKRKVIQIDTQDVQEVEGYRHTQGNRSGDKMKRINIILLPENHEFLKENAKLSRTTISKYFNYILNDTQDVQEVDDEYRVMNALAKRINMAFTDRNYEFVKKLASDTDISPSSLINQILDKKRDI